MPLGPAEQEVAAGVARAAEQHEPAAVRRVQAGGVRSLPQGPAAHAAAQEGQAAEGVKKRPRRLLGPRVRVEPLQVEL